MSNAFSGVSDCEKIVSKRQKMKLAVLVNRVDNKTDNGSVTQK